MLHFRDKHEVSFEVSKILIRDLYPVLRKRGLYKTEAERRIKLVESHAMRVQSAA